MIRDMHSPRETRAIGMAFCPMGFVTIEHMFPYWMEVSRWR